MRAALEELLNTTFRSLRRSVRKNSLVVTEACFRLLGAGRSGYGRLSLAAIARLLPPEGSAHAREKRLHRFLDNPRLDPRSVTDGLARLVFGRRGTGLWPIVFDQTRAGSTQALVAAVPYAGRSLPLAVYTFDYPRLERAALSQNQLEEVFLCDVETSAPPQVRPVFIGDRGYARAMLFRHCAAAHRLFIIRGRAGTAVSWQGHRQKLSELTPGNGRAMRYSGVLYQATEKVPVDVVAYRGPGHAEPWWLILPRGSEALLPTATVVALYRERMQIEQSFRDFKTHLGLRGLQLEQRTAARLGRLLLAFLVSYLLLLAVGNAASTATARNDLEIPRRRARHGTTRALSALSLATLVLVHPRWRLRALRWIHGLLRRLARGQPLLPPPLADRVLTPA